MPSIKTDVILQNSDEVDSEASPIIIPGMGRRISGEDRTNSLNTSTVEQEGKIDSSPKKNQTNQLFAGKQ